MDIERLYKDFNIPYATEGHKHCRPGWINVVCPHCTGNPGLHMSYNFANDRFVCWRCGPRFTNSTLSLLLNVHINEVKKIVLNYGLTPRKTIKKGLKKGFKAFKYPSPLVELQSNHRKYLIERNFNPDKLINEWQLMGTGVFARLDNINYKFRIIIPIMWEGKIISFDSRDITGKSSFKYMACPEERETVPHKNILYGNENKWGEAGICVEGYTDVWRMGFSSFSTSGIKYTFRQLTLIAKRFKRVAVMFDDEPQAVKQANKLVADLKFRKVDAFRVDIENDPGALSQEEADYMVKQLIG